MMERTVINTDKAPAAIGPYSQAVQVTPGTLLFTAGQIPLDPATGGLTGGSIKEQTRQVLKNLKSVLEAGGSGLSQVIKTTVFLKNMEDFPLMNEVYAEFFHEDPPARSAVEAARLPKDVLVEIECIALVKK